MTNEQFINDPGNWPYWPCLPMKKVDKGDLTCGLMLAHKTPPYKVYVKVNLFDLHERPGETWEQKLENTKTAEYDTVEGLLKEWEID